MASKSALKDVSRGLYIAGFVAGFLGLVLSLLGVWTHHTLHCASADSLCQSTVDAWRGMEWVPATFVVVMIIGAALMRARPVARVNNS